MFTVGGWIGGLVCDNFFAKMILKKFSTVSVELQSIANDIQGCNENIYVLFNYRDYTQDKESFCYKNHDEPLKLVYFSRLMTDKGIFKALELYIRLVNMAPNKFTLDIYGTLCFEHRECELDFFDKLSENIVYHGSIQPNEIVSKLRKYHALIFPSFYAGEGFPGCVVDAKMSDLFVIATDWKFNGDVIQHEFDGFLYPVDTYVREATKLLMEISVEDVNNLRLNSKLSAEDYTVKSFNAWYDRLFKIK